MCGGRGDVYYGAGGDCNSIRSESRRMHCTERYLYTSLQCVGIGSVVLNCSVFLCGGVGDVYCGTGGDCNSIRVPT